MGCVAMSAGIVERVEQALSRRGPLSVLDLADALGWADSTRSIHSAVSKMLERGRVVHGGDVPARGTRGPRWVSLYIVVLGPWPRAGTRPGSRIAIGSYRAVEWAPVLWQYIAAKKAARERRINNEHD